MKKIIRKSDRSHALNAALALALVAVVVTGANDRRNTLSSHYTAETMRPTAEPTTEQVLAVALAAARDLLDGTADLVVADNTLLAISLSGDTVALSSDSLFAETSHPRSLHHLAARLHNLPPPIA